MRSKIALFSATLLATVLLFGCSGGSGVDLKKSNAKEAIEVVEQLHQLIEKRQYEKTHVLFSDKFTAVNDWKDVAIIYDSCQNLGTVKKLDISSCEITEGAKGSVLYDLMVQVTRTNVNSTEQYQMQKTEGTPKILSFKIIAVPYVE